MKSNMQYIVDENGVKTSVIVPFQLWERLNSDYQKLQNKVEVLLAIKDGLSEIKGASKNYQEFQTLSDFVNESDS
jgi:hypothetical protein